MNGDQDEDDTNDIREAHLQHSQQSGYVNEYAPFPAPSALDISTANNFLFEGLQKTTAVLQTVSCLDIYSCVRVSVSLLLILVVFLCFFFFYFFY